MSPLSKNLFVAMAENGRYTYLNSVINSFGTIMAAHRGEVVCEVTSAKVDEYMYTVSSEFARPSILSASRCCHDKRSGERHWSVPQVWREEPNLLQS